MTSPLHGEDPGFKSPWAHLILVTKIDPDYNNTMHIELDGVKSTPYSNLVDSIPNPETRRGYTRNLKAFLNLIPNSIFEEHCGRAPKSRSVEDMSEAFLDLAKRDAGTAKSIIKSYLKELNKAVSKGELSPNTVPNKVKPIKALLTVNDVDISWKLINKMFPREMTSQDRAYTREEIQNMLEHCTGLTDKVIVLMFSSAGFRLEAWDYFCWKDLIFFEGEEGFKGAALRVYRGDPEEYWTFVTPELNPIEVEWRVMRRALSAKVFGTLEEMERSVRAMVRRKEILPVKMVDYLMV